MGQHETGDVGLQAEIARGVLVDAQSEGGRDDSLSSPIVAYEV